MSGHTPSKSWADVEDDDDLGSDLASRLGGFAKADSPAPDSKPVPEAQSLASRIGGLATDDNDEKDSKPSSSEKPRPSVNKSNPLLGKALAGANADRSSPSASSGQKKEDASKDKMNGPDDGEPLSPSATDISNDFQVEVKLADQQADPNSPLYSVKSFEELPIHDDLKKGIYAMNYTKPSKIQEKALPLLLANPQSGTGKTAAFSLAMLSRVDAALCTPQAICLAPSRELARQTVDVIEKLAQFTEIKVKLVVPGSWSRSQKITEQIVVGTPGTLVDILSRGGRILDHSQIRVVVVDEADELLALQGLGDQTMRIKKMIPGKPQMMLFSATFPDQVQEYAELFCPQANSIYLKKEEVTVDAIKQLKVECANEEDKFDVLALLYDVMTIGQSMVFCKKKVTADQISERLESDGHSVACLHGDKMSDERDKILDDFRQGKTKVLITTNVVARGIDIQQVNMVVNYDVPIMGPDEGWAPDIETYIHRIGRTGRFGRKGCAVTFIDGERSGADVKAIEDALGKPMKQIDARNKDDLDQLEQVLKAALKDPK
ncbi:ATP-dependent RNA helicase [Trichosporon asahii var. asahii CBS 8904]|uniref:RNA helicase n=1 Tax=Trichosporon asahii var. asahii (strain CBS 8904) TaxID=1220162 RepID=K1WH19_TRIAC|nr:ATP-dependent RNA helicase [Trichosporon asahii var. asahii CBS 8904]